MNEIVGLGKEEWQIYKTLLYRGPLSASDIVRKTGIHRPAVYAALSILSDLELVKIVPKGKYKTYKAESPEKIEQLFEGSKEKFNKEIIDLKEHYNSNGKRPIITYSEGDKAIVSVFADVVNSLPKDGVYFRYSPALRMAREKYVPNNYREIRDKKNLERYIITDESSKKIISKKLGKEVKSVPKDVNLFDLNITQIIYGEKVALIDYNSKTVIVIENKMIAEFQKKIFKLLYSKL